MSASDGSIPVYGFKPLSPEVADCFPTEVVFSNYGGFVDALLIAKNYLGLSNSHVEHMIGLVAGHVDKNLGPSRIKNIGPTLFDDYLECFAVEFVMRVNPAAEKRMKTRWEGRNKKRVRPYAHSMSMAVMERAKGAFHKEKAEQLTNGRKKIAPERRSKIARRAAKARWRRPRLAPPIIAVGK